MMIRKYASWCYQKKIIFLAGGEMYEVLCDLMLYYGQEVNLLRWEHLGQSEIGLREVLERITL